MVNRIDSPDQQLPEYVRGYITNPRETFSCELKTWIDPSVNDHDQVKIAKACLALRNKGGGTMLIGISDGGASLDLPNDYDPDALFTQDSVQAIVSAYSAQQFGVDVHHVQLADPVGRRVVAIVVPGKISTPAMCKKDSRNNGYPIVRKGVIYTRTLDSNGTISSAPASQQDLEEITKRCFDNRVADIGQFLRDHLTVENIRILKGETEAHSEDPKGDVQQEIDDFAESSAEAFSKYLKSKGHD